MRAVLQRVDGARVEVEGEVVGEITGEGLVALVGAGVTLGPTIGFLAGLVCVGIAVITLGRLYRREFR